LLAYVIAMLIEFPVASLMKVWQNREERPPLSRVAMNNGDKAPLEDEVDA